MIASEMNNAGYGYGWAASHRHEALGQRLNLWKGKYDETTFEVLCPDSTHDECSCYLCDCADNAERRLLHAHQFTHHKFWRQEYLAGAECWGDYLCSV